jgi:outer membrane protein assembly factor BamB
LFHEDSLIVVGQEGTVEAYLAETGEFLWKLGFPEEELLPPCPMPEGILLAFRRGRLLFIASDTGKISRELETPTPMGTQPLRNDNVFFLASPEGDVTAYDAESNRVLWSTPTNEPAAALAKGGDLLVVSGSEATLTGIDTKNGQIRWTFRSRGAFEAPAVFDAKGERLFIGDRAGTFYSLNTKNGKRHYRWETGGAITKPVLVEGNTTYVVSYSNTLFAFRTGNGHELWRANLPGRPASGPVRVGIRLIVATFDGHVVEIDPMRGRPAGQPFRAPDTLRDHPSFDPPFVALTLYMGRILLLCTKQPTPEIPPTELEGPPRPPPKKETAQNWLQHDTRN